MADGQDTSAGVAPAEPVGSAAPAPATPAATPAPPVQSPAPAPEAGPGAGASSPEPPPPELRLAPEDVPYPKFREIEMERTRYKREAEQLRQQYEPLAARVPTLEQQITDTTRRYEEARSAQEDLDHLLGIVQSDPDLKRQVFEALNSGRPMPSARSAPPPRTPAEAAAAGLPPEQMAKLDRVFSIVERAEQAERQAVARSAQAALDTQVEQMTNRYLTERGYDPSVIVDKSRGTKLSDIVLDFIATEAEGLGGGKIEDVPHLLNRWYARTESVVQHRIRGYTDAKVADARNIPPSLPGGSPPVSVENRPLPVSDPRVATQAIAYLRSRLQGAA